MKQHWERFALRIDALTLRERVIVFAMAALILIVLVNQLLLDPQYSKQKQLTERIRSEQSQTASLQAEIGRLAMAQDTDPDELSKSRLKQLQQELHQARTALGTVQEGLIAPDRMAALLEDVLSRHGGLRLVSLTTLPVSSLLPPPADASATPQVQTAPAPVAASPGVYKHGVEVVVRGSYPEIVSYLSQLEAMPWQLFWSRARMTADYPDATLTLTLYTLSLDDKWMKL